MQAVAWEEYIYCVNDDSQTLTQILQPKYQFSNLNANCQTSMQILSPKCTLTALMQTLTPNAELVWACARARPPAAGRRALGRRALGQRPPSARARARVLTQKTLFVSPENHVF